MKRLFLCLLLLLSLPVQAAALKAGMGAWQNRHATVQYGVYAGGVHALNATVRFDTTKDTFNLSMDAKPSGWLGTVLPWAGHHASASLWRNGALQSLWHDKQSAWREDRDHLHFTYKNGTLVRLEELTQRGQRTGRHDLPLQKQLHDNTVDLLTGVAQMLVNTARNGTCNGNALVFDGKRRYRMVMIDRGIEELMASDLNFFSGAARACDFELQPLAGFSGKPRGFFKLQQEGKAQGKLPRVWLAPLWANGPPVPVKLLLKSEYGAVLFHVSKKPVF